MNSEIEIMKHEAQHSPRFGMNAAWRETGERLIHCQLEADGSFTFRNTTSATKRGPIITEAQAAAFLATGADNATN